VDEQGAATQEIVRNVSPAADGNGNGNVSGVAGSVEQTGAAASQILASDSEHSEHLGAEVERVLASVRAAGCRDVDEV